MQVSGEIRTRAKSIIARFRLVDALTSHHLETSNSESLPSSAGSHFSRTLVHDSLPFPVRIVPSNTNLTTPPSKNGNASTPPSPSASLPSASAASDTEAPLPFVLFSSLVDAIPSSDFSERFFSLEVGLRYELLKKTLRDVTELKDAGQLDPSKDYTQLEDDDYYLGVDVYSVLVYLNDLALVREISLTTARCYRRWLGSFFESLNHPDASLVRLWVIPHTNEFYVSLFGFLEIDNIDNDDATDSDLPTDTPTKSRPLPSKLDSVSMDKTSVSDLRIGSFALSSLSQLDLFGADDLSDSIKSVGDVNDSNAPVSPADESSETTNVPTKASIDPAIDVRDSVFSMYMDTATLESRIPVGEYNYITKDVCDELITELTAVTRKGAPRYKHGSITAALFMATIMTGLRPLEWSSCKYHDSYFDPRTKITLPNILEVHSLKQANRRDDNPLRPFRLLVLKAYTKNELAFIRGVVENFNALSAQSSPEKVISLVRACLNYTWNKLVKSGVVPQTNKLGKEVHHNGVSLYTARHVFAEEVRRSQAYTRFDMAALLGHTTTVNQIYYTRRRKLLPRSYQYTLPEPWPEDSLEIELWCNDVMPNRLKLSDLKKTSDKFESDIGQTDSIDDFSNYR